VVSRMQWFGYLLPALEVALVLVPLAVHVTLGLRTLRREDLKLGVAKHHHGSDVRYWLQRVTAAILLMFLIFHLATMHRWGFHLIYQITRWPGLADYAAGGLFEPQRAFSSVAKAVSCFWDEHPANPANLLMTEFYLLAIASAVYHLCNGMATGMEVLGFVTTGRQKAILWRICTGGGIVLAVIGLAGWRAFTSVAHP